MSPDRRPRRRVRRADRRRREPLEQRRERKRRALLRKDILRVAAVMVLFGAIALLLDTGWVRANILDISSLRASLHPPDSIAGRLWSYAVFCALASAMICVGVPRIWVSAAAGSIYGAALGISIALASSLLGASGTYLLGSSLLRSMVRRRFEPRLARWSGRFREDAFFWVLYLRLFPVSNATLTSLVCGCLRVDFRAFLAANSIGFVPLTVVFALFGSAAAKGNALQLFLGGAVFLAAIFAQWLLARSRRARAAADDVGAT